ncbi:MAG: Crp/Fnr family transcriptional regulator [Caldimonas sp.]
MSQLGARIAVSPPVSAVIEQAAFFAPLAPRQRAGIADITRLRTFPSHSDIYALGDTAAHCYVLVAGVVKFHLPVGGRTAAAGDIIRRGELFGWAALVRGCQRRMGTAFCATECCVAAIDGDALLQLMDADHSMGYAIMTGVSLITTGTITSLVTG